MKIIILTFVSIISNIFAQVNITQTIDLQLGNMGAERLILVDLSWINSAIVFQRLPTTAMCPTTRAGEFELKKVSPKPWGSATHESIRGFCTSIDSISIDTSTIYEINTSRGETYYMRLLELVQEKVRIQITSEKPVAQVLLKNTSSSNHVEEQEFLANGKKVKIKNGFPINVSGLPFNK